MSESSKDTKKEMSAQVMPFDKMFGNLRDELENAVKTWSTSPWIPSLFDYDGIRVPLCEVVDKGHFYELHIELPGVGKDNVKVKANSHSIEVSGKKTGRIKQSQKGRIYTERSESSFYRQIPLPGEIIPQKVKSKIKNGILFVQLPKRNPEKSSKAKVIE